MTKKSLGDLLRYLRYQGWIKEITERLQEITEVSLRVPWATMEIVEHFLGNREPLDMRGLFCKFRTTLTNTFAFLESLY